MRGNHSSEVPERNGGDEETRTRDLCRDSLGVHVLSATYIPAGAAKSLKGTGGYCSLWANLWVRILALQRFRAWELSTELSLIRGAIPASQTRLWLASEPESDMLATLWRWRTACRVRRHKLVSTPSKSHLGIGSA